MIMRKYVLDHNDILNMLPDRAPDSHKGDFGKILLLCGSRGYTGAAALAAMGALRCGAGLVYLAVPESIYAIEAAKLLEPIVLPLADDEGGFSQKAIDEVAHLMTNKDAVLIGPGIGKTKGTEALLNFVLESFHGPVVVDADGINLLAANRDILRGRKAATVITPHLGEFRRIGGADGPREASAVAIA